MMYLAICKGPDAAISTGVRGESREGEGRDGGGGRELKDKGGWVGGSRGLEGQVGWGFVIPGGGHPPWPYLCDVGDTVVAIN